jgi:hypothetical protein
VISAAPSIVDVSRIWDQGAHNAFTDLIRWRHHWYCTFRESDDHVGGDGQVRVLISADAASWESAALIAEAGIDLRDPKLSITPDDRLMIVANGTVYEGERWLGRQPRVMFSPDGGAWSAPQRVQAEGDWLWSLTWHEGRAYGVTYRTPPGEWTTTLVSSADGHTFEEITTFAVSGWPNEAAVRFMPGGEMVALLRRDAGNYRALVGRAEPPYSTWAWRETRHRIGGPNFIRLPGGELWAGGRSHHADGIRTVIGRLNLDGSLEPALALPSGGDTGYPGLVWHDDLLWVSYYASHEGKASIYLARIDVRASDQ